MAMFLVRLAAAGAGCALLLAVPSARAGDRPVTAAPSGHAADPGRTSKASVSTKHDARSGTSSRAADSGARRSIAGGPTSDEASMGAESPELRALRDAERELFPPASPAPGNAWPSDLPLVMPSSDAEPAVHASGLPPGRTAPPPPSSASSKDLSWLAKLEMPDIPVRWDDRVVRYLEYFRDDPRGHATFGNLFRKSGRWREMMRRSLRRKTLPDDLVWVSMIESGFDPTARSAAAAAGLWQFTADTAKIYGLTVDRWLDQRLEPQVATDAAVDLLGDLHRRFGSWEMALAAYDMGYAGLSAVVRRYNTNDFWSLSRTEGTLPWETTLYVPKIVAAAVVTHNLAAFGFGDVSIEPAVQSEEVTVPPGTSLATVAQAAASTLKDLQALNPELRASRTPPLADGDAAYPVKVPMGKAAAASQALAKLHREQPPLERYVVRFGETLEQIAAAHKSTPQRLVELNAIAPGEAVRGGTVLLVPKNDGGSPASAPPPASAAPGPASGAAGANGTGAKPSVIVPADVFVYPDRRRVFYRVQVGDTLKEIAGALRVSVEDLDRWNDLDPSARLQEGMTLQAFVGTSVDLSRVVVLSESDVSVLPVGSEEFFAALERDKGFRRVTVTAKEGDTLESIGRRYDCSARTMERINRRGRNEALKPGDTVVAYGSGAAAGGNASKGPGATASSEPAPNGPLPVAPVPDLLP